ncbi:porin family protein [Winogradskyella echinorum]|uniref:Porin family protein n=1 Tax=Winogradskyella echinorum TaxID=538189 RepID=A0ABR6Y4X2_9FLAO|nr:outer membrane beta-barrel protein [Winogradskyella echinorum]MBC3847806.1 porin family protein [Winogradskyella echinorum]MBC5752154.1 porin family protein [Winogradskyella echinorum]
MRKLCFTTLLICAISITAAQDSSDLNSSMFDFGIRHGYSNWDISTDYSGYNNFQLYAGLFVETNFSERLGIRLETNYSRRGLIEVPLLLKYKISDKFEFYGGTELIYSFDSYDNYNAKDKEFGGSFIFGMQYNINKHWFIEVRYNHGFTDQFSIGRYGESPMFGKKRTISFGVGYKF